MIGQNTNAQAPMKRLALILMGGAGLVLLGGGGLFLGLNSKLTTLQTSAEKKETEVSSNEGIARRYQTTLSDYNETEGRIKYLESSVSAKSYVPTLLKQVQMLAAQTHLDVTSVRPALAPPPAPVAARSAGSDGGATGTSASKATPPPYDTLDVEVDMTGTYADTSVFLYSLTRFPKIVAVDGVQMHPNAAAPGTVQTVTTNLRLTAFMFHDDGTSSTAPTDADGAASGPITVPVPVLVPAVRPVPASLAPPVAAGTVSGAVERAAVGAVAAGRAENARNSSAMTTL